MKNLFKKLALVLALAFTVSVAAPAASASAATAPAYKKVGKILYVGGDVSGTIPATYRFYFNNAAGYTATWKTSDSKIAKIDAKSGVITAVAPGKATITATLTNKAGKKCVLTNTVWVKQNADEVDFGSKTKIENGLKVGEKVKINVARILDGKKIWSQSDFSLITDAIVWTTSDASVATVDKWGTVTAKKAGEVTITASATQSNGNLVSAKNSYTVSVVDGLTTVAQKDTDSVSLSFGSAVTKDTVNKNTVKLFEIVGSTKVARLVKDVTIDEKDATKVVLDAYTPFKKDTTYVVEFDGKTFEFKGADTSASAVAQVVITTTEAVKGEATKVKYQLLTANGVDITSEVPDSRVSITTKSNDCYLNEATKEVTFFESGKAATFELTFHTYTYNEVGVENTITTEATINSVDASTVTLGSLKTWTLNETDNKSFDFDKSTVNKKLTLSESNGLFFIGEYVKSDKTKVLTNNDAKFTFESSDKNILIVNGSKLYPVAQGTATLVIKYDGKVVDALTITVLPKRTPAELTATVSKSSLSKVEGDSSTLTVTVKDNYLDNYTGEVKITLLATSVDGAMVTNSEKLGTKVVTDGKYEVKFNGADFSHAGTYTLKITCGNVSKVIVFTVVTAGTAVENPVLSISKTDIDTTLKLTTVTGKNVGFTSDITLTKVDKDGNYVEDAACTLNKPVSSTSVQYYYEVYDVKGNLINAENEDNYIFVTDKANAFSAVVNDGKTIKKAPVGTYRVAYYKVVNDAVTPLGQKFITVTDAQADAKVSLENAVSTKSDVVSAITAGDILVMLDIDNDGELEKLTTADAAEGGYTLGTFAIDEIIGSNTSGSTVYVKTVDYTHDITLGDTTVSYTQTITVNTQITLK